MCHYFFIDEDDLLFWPNRYEIIILSRDIQLNPGPLNKTSESWHTFDHSQFECFQQKGMHFVHLNARSLLPKISELRHFAVKTKPAIIAITETWLDKSVTEGEVGIDGYTLQRNDRNRSGGVVCLYIQNRYAFTSMNIIDSDEYESLWINIFLPKTKPIQVGVCYRPPSQANFLELFEKSLSQ